MMLGDVLAAARRSGDGMQDWLEPADPDLWARIGRQGDPAEVAQAAIAAFSDHASEEDWAMLVSRMRGAEDPGRACLLTMMRWRLDALQEHDRHIAEGTG